MQLTSPLDGDWGTLIGKNDFVPFLHEMVFAGRGRPDRAECGRRRSTRNDNSWRTGPADLVFDGPDGNRSPPR